MSEELISLQRRSTKLDVKLTPFVSFSAFEDHVGTQFDIGKEVSSPELDPHDPTPQALVASRL